MSFWKLNEPKQGELFTRYEKWPHIIRPYKTGELDPYRKNFESLFWTFEAIALSWAMRLTLICWMVGTFWLFGKWVFG